MGVYKYAYYGVSNPKHAINLNNGRYVVADYGNNRVIELDSTLGTVLLKNYAINSPVFVDYNEQNETLLITSESLNLIREVTWSDLDYGTEIWHSTCTLNSPQSSTYRQGSTNVVISNTGNNQVITYSRDSGLYTTFDHYNLYSNENASTHDFTSFYRPFRSYQYRNGDICVVEKEGRELGWDTIESSSSSGSSSSSYIENWSSSSNSSSSNSSSSSYIENWSSSSSSSENVLHVAGNGASPNPTGAYTLMGVFNGYPYYFMSSTGYYIFFSSFFARYIISPLLFPTTSNTCWSADVGLIGNYTHRTPYTGHPTVTQ